jgi:hypothetical protein
MSGSGVRREKVARRLRVGASPTEKSSRDWLGWLQDRQIGGLRAFENPSDIDANLWIMSFVRPSWR